MSKTMTRYAINPAHKVRTRHARDCICRQCYRPRPFSERDQLWQAQAWDDEAARAEDAGDTVKADELRGRADLCRGLVEVHQTEQARRDGAEVERAGFVRSIVGGHRGESILDD